jgi:signal transduction histidine kinase
VRATVQGRRTRLPDRVDQRASALHDAGVRIARAETREEIATVAVDAVFDVLGAAAAVVYSASEGALVRLAARALPVERDEAMRVLPLDAPYPLATAVATSEPVWIESYDDLVRLYPVARQAATPASKLQSIAAVPFRSGGTSMGGLAVSFDRPRAVESRDRTFLLTLAEHVALALERSRLSAENQAARNRLTVLAEASRRFTEARLDLGAVLDTVAHEISHRLGDSCAISLLSKDRMVLEPVALHHVDPEANESTRRTLADAPVRMDEPSVLARVASTGQAVLMPVVPMAAMLATLRPEYRSHLERYPISSLLVVPLRVHDEVIGTMTVSRGPPGPPYTTDDQELLQDLADRASFAIANARLFAEAREAVALRDDFLSIAGHELNTPLAAMQLQIQSILRQAGPSGLDPKFREKLARVGGNVSRLGRLVASLLDVSMISEGGLVVDRQPTDLAALAREVVEGLRPEAEDAGCTIVLDAPPSLSGSWDRLRVEQLLVNLLGNAVKYGDGQPIEITVSAQEGSARIVVRDHGIGIPPEHEARVFQRFERAVSPRHYSGFGLGLWIARQIAEGHGGTIRYERPAGSGACFLVDLPSSPP